MSYNCFSYVLPKSNVCISIVFKNNYLKRKKTQSRHSLLYIRAIKRVVRQCIPGRNIKRLKTYCITRFCQHLFQELDRIDCHDHCIRLFYLLELKSLWKQISKHSNHKAKNIPPPCFITVRANKDNISKMLKVGLRDDLLSNSAV